MENSYYLDVFIKNLLGALRIITDALYVISLRINQEVNISLGDVLVYGGLVSIVVTTIKDMSYNGVFTIEKEKREKME